MRLHFSGRPFPLFFRSLIVSRLALMAIWTASLVPLRAEAPATAIAAVDGVLLPARSVVLSLPAEAVLREVRAKEGERVERGRVLAILYSPVEALDRDRARKKSEHADYLSRVGDELFATASISEEAARQRRFEAESAAIELARAEAVLADKTLFAPFDGIVLRIHREAGETVGRVEKIVEMVDISTLHVDAYLDATRLGQVKAGDRARVESPRLPDCELAAEVELVDPVMDAGSGLFRVRLNVANPGLDIPSGLPVSVHFSR